MRTFKRIDFWLQTMILALAAISTFIMADGIFEVGYLVVGTFQLMSIIIHQVNGWFTNRGSNRYTYHIAAVFTLLSWVLWLLVPSFIYIYYLLIVIVPCMAVIYMVICFRELKVLDAKAYIHLK